MNKFLRKLARYDFNGWGTLPDYVAERKLQKEMEPFLKDRGENTDKKSDYSKLAAWAKMLQEKGKLTEDEALGALIKADLNTEDFLNYKSSFGYTPTASAKRDLMQEDLEKIIETVKNRPQSKLGLTELLKDTIINKKKDFIDNVKKGRTPSGIHYKTKEIPEERLKQAYKNIVGKDYEKPGLLRRFFMDTRFENDLPTALYWQYDPHYNTEKFTDDELAWLAEQVKGKYLPRNQHGADAFYVDPMDE